MVTLIEKQQVKKRNFGYHSDTVHGFPGIVDERPRSVAGQQWLVRREPLVDQLEKAGSRVRDLVYDPSAQVVEPKRSRRKTTTRLVSAPLLSVLIATVVLGGIVAAITGTRHHVTPLPKGGLALRSDGQIDGVLADYANSSGQLKPDLPVNLPNPTILERLKTSSYTIKQGDTISGIAAKEHVRIETLISFNGITDVRRLNAGMVLKIPSMNGTLYRVKKGDTLEGIAKLEGVKLANVLDANSIKSSVIVPGQELFMPGGHMSSFAYRKALGTLFEWPTVGVITSPFGMRHDPFTGIMEFHNGIDIANVLGTPIKAAMDGAVAMVGRNRGYGNFIILNNGNGFQTLYGHLSKSLVQKGQYVRAGQEIALMGDTGYATGPHLHFTIYKSSAPVNPLQYLPKR